MESTAHIRVEHLSVWYGDHPALRDVSLSIPDGKITAIIGPSGCGKTTLLKSFNRLVDLQEGVRIEGRILVDGEDIHAPGLDVTRLRKKMGLLFQRPQVLPMSIFENVAYGLRIHGERDRRRLEEKVVRYLKVAGLWDEVKERLGAPAARLSIGQQQRLCLARGLAVEPEAILGDEPTSALDPISAEQIEQRFLELKKDYTIVLVTHILRQARRLADYVAFVYFGELVEHGPTAEVLDAPKDPRTEAYVSGRFLEHPSGKA
jgi:phosphate transport system ATP-binding protein